ncbi:MAG: aspartate aminotransferase family protein [Chloroflexia bacterium]|nr:aspartate aminotransferase family protein [Chloroflexia bacterium]
MVLNTNSDILAVDRGLQPALYNKREIALVRGNGVTLWDAEGKSYLDAMSNYGVNVLGHAHPAVTEAITQQAGTLISCHQSFANDVRARFLEILLALAPENLTRAFLCNSGAEAIEAGLKFARVATGRPNMVAARGAYHGRTAAASEVTGGKHSKQSGGGGAVTHVPYNNLDALDGAVDDQTAAIIIEPIQGEGGINVPDDGYLLAADQIAQRNGALLILDEVQTTLRTGVAFAAAHDGVQPDILCTAKGLANGVPIGAALVSDAVAAELGGGIYGSTFGGNPLACAAGLATLQTIEAEGLLPSSVELGEQLRSGIEGLNHPSIRAVRGRGLMTGVEFRTRVTPILRGLQERGVLALPAGSLVIRFLPPLIIQPTDVELMVETLGETLATGS